MNSTNLIPNVSVGKIKLGVHINEYLDIKHVLYKKPEGDPYMEDSYEFVDPPIIVFVNDDNLVTTINCKIECHWKGVNLIGLDFSNFIELAGKESDSQDDVYLLIAANKGQTQRVYVFERFGLQVWTWRNKIVTVSCTDYDGVNPNGYEI